MNKVKHHCKENMLFDLRVGNTLSTKDVIDDTTLPQIHYQQGDLSYCLACSLASALYYLGLHLKSALIYQKRKALHECLDWKEKLKEVLAAHLPEYTMIKVADHMFTFDPLDGSRRVGDHVCLMVLQGEDGGCQHAITCVNNMIFDSNRKHAMKLNQENLDWCCSTDDVKVTFEKVHWAVVLMRLPLLLPSLVSRPKVSSVYNSLASLFDLMRNFTVSRVFLENESNCFAAPSAKALWKKLNTLFQTTQQLKELQLQKCSMMTDKVQFQFTPEKNIKIVLFKPDDEVMGSVLIGCWLLDCRHRQPVYVHSRSKEILSVFNARSVHFLKKEGDVKKQFEKLMEEFDCLSYGCCD